MKKMNLGFIMVGLVFLISISVLSCQADEADDYFQQAEDVTAADLFIASEAYQNLQKEIRKGIRRRRNAINELSSEGKEQYHQLKKQLLNSETRMEARVQLNILLKYDERTERNRIFSIFIVIGLTLLLLYGGKETVHTLNQPVQTTLFSIDGELRDNPLYAEGAERTIHNIHLFSSPYAQANYVPYLLHEEKQEKFDNSLILKNSPYHLEFLITDILGGIFLYLLGSYLFNKRNLQ